MKKSDVRHVRMQPAWTCTHKRMGGRRCGHACNGRDACLIDGQGMPAPALRMDAIPVPYGCHSFFPEHIGGQGKR